MRKTGALIALLLLPPALARAQHGVDLSYEFPGPPARTQGDVGACHAFAAVGLLEAAIYRAHGRRHVRLSERDLFVGKTVLSGQCLDGFCSGRLASVEEGDSIEDVLAFALERGVASESSYAGVPDRYESWRGDQNAWFQRIAGLEAELGFASVRLERRGGSGVKTVFHAGMPGRETWREMFSSPQWRAELGQLLGYDNEAVARSRAETRALTAGFSVVGTFFFDAGVRVEDAARRAAEASPAWCAARGQNQRHLLVEALDMRIPVAVAFVTTGQPEWDQGDSGGPGVATHSFLVTGYRARGGRCYFQTRNSWGSGGNHELGEAALCRILHAATVLTPAEGEARKRRLQAREAESRRVAEESARLGEALRRRGESVGDGLRRLWAAGELDFDASAKHSVPMDGGNR